VIRKVDLPSYKLDSHLYKRFDERRTIFGRMVNDTNASFYKKGMYDNIRTILSKKKTDYSRIELAQVLGAWTVYDYFHGAFSWEELKNSRSVMSKPFLEKYTVEEPTYMSEKVKETARMYGANLVGICEVDQKWLYSHDILGNAIEIPAEFKYAIIMAIAMDTNVIKSSPSFAACRVTALGYSQMAFCIASIAEFIRSLGYRAIPMGNDTALSIPLAIDAGLGELGRNGLLITPEFGPCIRLCKVFTDLPLEIDKPVSFGVTDFCKRCRKCIDACEVGAIQGWSEPSYDVVSPSNNNGILRWPVNHDRCYSFWLENGGECSNCIAVCPFMENVLNNLE